jgi:hypothetical protein
MSTLIMIILYPNVSEFLISKVFGGSILFGQKVLEEKIRIHSDTPHISVLYQQLNVLTNIINIIQI